MIRGIGLDICQISRMAAIMEDGRFIKRYFAKEEQDYLMSKNKSAAQSAAGLYAAKEAALKALGVGIAHAPLCDVAVLHTDLGQPYYDLRGKAAQLIASLGGGNLHLSITHDGDTAAAVALWKTE